MAAPPFFDQSDRSGMLWGPCPLCDEWMVDVVWSELDGPPLTYTQVVFMVEEALVEHFTEHSAAVVATAALDGSPTDG